MFDLLDNFRGSMVLGLREQDVNVVAHRIDLNQVRVVVLEGAGDVGVELPAFLVAQELAATFGAEHETHDDVGEGLGHDGEVGFCKQGTDGPFTPAL
jgi:hypothetical protein